MGTTLSKVAQGALAIATLVATTTLVSSCVAVLDLDDYAGAAQSICEHLRQCYGESAYEGCEEHVTEGLSTASAEDREAWLASLTKEDEGGSGCLAQCSSGKACLDAQPICNDSGESCSQTEQCCDFLDNTLACADGRCCFADGQICDDTSDCCNGCDVDTGTCGGAVACQPQGEVCIEDEDCCSGNCRDDGVCGFVCRERGEDCDEGGECCSGLCESGFCACRQRDQPCQVNEQCCSGSCVAGSCFESEGCAGPEDPCDPNGEDCCTIQVLEGTLECLEDVQDTRRCCLPNGQNIGGAESGICCSGSADGGGQCCPGLGSACMDGNDCCQGLSCVPVASLNTGRCCQEPSCLGDPCSFPQAPARTVGCDYTPNESLCIAQVCLQRPVCCCGQWDEVCADLAKPIALCADSCSTTN